MLQAWPHFQHSLQPFYDLIIYCIIKVAEKCPEIHSSGRYTDMKKGKVSKSLFLGYTDPADRSIKLLGNVGSHLPMETVSYPTRLESQPTTLPEPHITMAKCFVIDRTTSFPFNSKVSFRGNKKSYHQGNNPVFIVFEDSDHIHHLQHKTDHAVKVQVSSAVMWGEWKGLLPPS